MKRQAYCLKQNQHLTQRWGWQDLVTSWVEVGRTSAPPGEDLNQASRAAERVEFRTVGWLRTRWGVSVTSRLGCLAGS